MEEVIKEIKETLAECNDSNYIGMEYEDINLGWIEALEYAIGVLERSK